MGLIGAVPRRCVNLPPGSLWTLLSCSLSGKSNDGPHIEQFEKQFAQWVGASYAFGASKGRSAFQLGLEALDLKPGCEIIFPAFTFPIMPLVAKLMGFKPVFCDVDPRTFNSNRASIEASITENTGAVLATHLFGQPCDINEIASLCRDHGIRLLEDCAHACGVRVNGKSVGTFGDVGVFSFAQGKNMPCFGGGAISVMDPEAAKRAKAVIEKTPIKTGNDATKEAVSVWIKWLLTRPIMFGLTAYPVLRRNLSSGKPLMDSAVGNELLDKFTRSNPGFDRLKNIQAALGLRQLKHIDKFNDGARKNAQILSDNIGEVPGVKIPHTTGSDHIYVYYPLTVDSDKRDDLRHYLLRHKIDTKTTDMSDCSKLNAFSQDNDTKSALPPREASVLEICVYPTISRKEIYRIARTIRAWASLPPL